MIELTSPEVKEEGDNEVIREDLKVVGLTENMAQDRRLWRDRIKILDHREMTS